MVLGNKEASLLKTIEEGVPKQGQVATAQRTLTMSDHIHGDEGGEYAEQRLGDHPPGLLDLSLKQKRSKRANSPSSHRKTCDLCHGPKDVLVRCRIDETQKWHFVCTSKCWKEVSGGEIDGPSKPDYKYGGMWKNKYAGVSAKKPKQKVHSTPRAWSGSSTKYTKNDKVEHGGRVWVCRRSHISSESTEPGLGYAFWNEDASISSEITQI